MRKLKCKMLRWQMEESPSRILSGKKIEELAICGKRFKLVQDMLKYIPNGTRRIADVERVGPANIEKCKMAVEEWDRIVKGREENGQCKGVFFTSFSGKNNFRRCEVLVAAKEDVCELCKRMRGQADAKGLVSVAGQPEYEIVHKSLFKRPGVMACVAFWKEEAEMRKAKYNLKREYPFFSANEMISWLMVDGGVIFKNGGKGGRAYRRSAVVVREQDSRDFKTSAFTRGVSTVRSHECSCCRCLLTLVQFLAVDARAVFLVLFMALTVSARAPSHHCSCC